MLIFRNVPAFTRLQHRTAIDGLRRIGRTHADFPLFVEIGQGFSWQRHARYAYADLAVTKAFTCANRDKKRVTHARL